MQPCVYSIALSDGRCYVGSTCDPFRRRKDHSRLLARGKHHSPYLQNAFDKHGPEALVFRVLEVCEPETLLSREQHWIDSSEAVFNFARVAGSRKGVRQSPETIAKVRALHVGRKVSPETRAQMSASAMGNKRGAGHKLSAEHKAAIGLVHASRVHAKGIPRSAETKEKVAAAQRGVPRPYARGKRSPEWIENMRAAALRNSDNRRRASLVRWARVRGEPEP